MARIGWRKVWLLVLGSVLLTGCGKQVKLSFFNLTSDTLDVYVTSPSQGRQEVGFVPPMGTINYTLIVPNKLLPVVCTWQAGSVSQSFRVDKGTGDQQVKLLPGGAAEMHEQGAPPTSEPAGDTPAASAAGTTTAEPPPTQ